MFEIVIVFSAFGMFNNSLHFNLCGAIHDASYIYLDSHNILFGVITENSTITHFNYTLIDECNQSNPRISNRISKRNLITDDNSIVTRHTVSNEISKSNEFSKKTTSIVTRLQTDKPEILNLTDTNITRIDKYSSHHYYLLFVSVVTFLIGLVVPPKKIYEFLKKYGEEQYYSGNYISRIRTKL